MLTAARFTVYADLNCPFCHALSERFHLLELDDAVEWRPIQHAPTISSDQCTYDVLSELASEVAEVRRRAPSTDIRTPPFRPNSKLASETLVEAFRASPIKSNHLRVLIYRALWLENRDISDPDVLLDLASRAGFESLAVCQQTKSNLETWQQNWEKADYEGNIPVTIISNGESLIGFPQQHDLDAFLATGRQSNLIQPAVCILKPKQRLLIFDSDPESIQLIMSVMGDYELDLVDNSSGLHQGLEDGRMPNLAIMDMDTLQRESPTLFANLKTDPILRDTPIILAAIDPDARREEFAYDMGASDFVRKPFNRTVLAKRLTAQMEIIRSNNLLEKMARFDPLTGAYNRRELDVRLQTEWDRCLRTGANLSVLMIDIDKFKEFNDNYGHNRGDECLRSIADILIASIYRPGDLLARFGGEEFVALLIGVDHKDANLVAERCRRNVEEAKIAHEYSGVANSVTISVGTATTVSAKSQNPLSLLEMADQALYKAKESGRNRVVGSAENLD